MYSIVKDDRKANFNNFDAWKYPAFSNLSFFETFRGLLPPLPPYSDTPAFTAPLSKIHKLCAN